MKRTDFSYDLPDELIARYPVEQRSASRLLHLDRYTGACADGSFCDLLDHLQAGDLLVFNNTKVIPARLWGQKETGGRIEILVERLLSDTTCLAHVRSSKSPKPGALLTVALDQSKPVEQQENAQLRMVAREGELFQLEALNGQSLLSLLSAMGHMPLPPYIDRSDENLDQSRYQTVYAEQPGAVAAPTAGLHFDEALMGALAAKGVAKAFVTLHVGAGTFQPVRADDVRDHAMHSEWLEVGNDVVESVKKTKAAGGRVFAVGTTSVRCLETAAQNGSIAPYKGDTNIFIYPGYEFKVIDGLVTNFHLPESTLIMLVSALAGRENVLRAYEYAIAQRYRFFSYGDAMLIC